MSWWRRNKEQVLKRQKDAEKAIVTARLGYMSMLNLRSAAERVAERHLKIQRENHYAFRFFGVEPP